MSDEHNPLRWHKAVGAGLALLLVAGTLWLAGFTQVLDLIIHVRPGELTVAAAAAGLSLVFRGFRLSLLLPAGSLGPWRAIPVAAVAQAAAQFVPARLGELALPWLIRRDTDRDGASGLAILLAARVLDTAALGGWAAIAIYLQFGTTAPVALAGALALLLPLAGVPAAVSAFDRWIASRAPDWGPTGRLWANRLHRTSAALDELRQRPLRLLGAVAASVGSWAMQWVLTWWLLAAMGLRWPAWDVVSGAAIASLSNLLPFNLVANLGTLEAGWTAAFSALGQPLDLAAATGLACHAWALVFAAFFGFLAWLTMVKRGENKSI